MKEFFEKHKIKIVVSLAAILFLVVGFIILPNDFKAFAKTDSFKVELGSAMDGDITTYIWGMEDALAEAKLDVSKVDIYKAGDYEAYVTIGNRTITYDVKIVDTVAPSLILDPSVKYVAMQREYDTSKFVSLLVDLSNTEEVFFKINDEYKDTISFETVGEYTITLVAKDESGNETEKTTTITVEVPPQFIGLVDVTIPVGASFDYSKGFVIYDETDGFITDTVVVNDEGVDLSVAGSYVIEYYIINSKGVDNKKTVTVTTSADATYDYVTANNLTTEELQILCDKGYFAYEPLEEDNYDEVLELIIPTSVNLGNENAAGSGFVYKITPEFLYIGSVAHVTRHLTTDGHIIFYNDVIIPCVADDVYMDSTNELSLVRINITDVPQSTLLTLKQAYVDVNIYEEDLINDSVVCHSENWGFDYTQMIYTKTILSINADVPALGYYDSAVETAGLLRAGMSGSALYDYRGRLIGVTSCIVNHSIENSKDRTYFMMIDEIETLEEMLNVQDVE